MNTHLIFPFSFILGKQNKHKILIPNTRGVHGSGQVEFVPDPDLTRNFRVGENRTWNRPKMLVRSAGLGRVRLVKFTSRFWFLSLVCYFGLICQDLAKSQQDLVESQRDLARSRGSGLDLTGSRRIWWVSSKLSRITSNIAGYCMFSSKNLWISPKVSGFMIGSGCSVFGRGKLPTDLKASGSVGDDPPPNVGVSVWAVFNSGSGGLLGLVRYTSWVDSPT